MTIMKKNGKLLLISSYILLFLIGCNDQPPNNIQTTSVNPDQLRQKATAIIASSLDDQDPRIRAKAIEVVATAKLQMLMPKVQQLLKDEYVPVRFAAAVAVGDTNYLPAKKAVTILTQVPEQNTKISAAYAAHKLKVADAMETLENAITSKDPIVRANAAVLMGKIGDQRAKKLLYWAMTDKNSDARASFAAAGALAKLGDEEILSKLWDMLLNVYADDRVYGIESMAELGTNDSKNAIFTMLDDEVPEVRLAAAEQLGKLGDNFGEQIVLDTLKNPPQGMNSEDIDRLNVRIVSAIGQLKTPALTPYLPDFLDNNSKLVKIAAAAAVFNLEK
jgi:HEAT repeat protein